jgi:hypothetical protein
MQNEIHWLQIDPLNFVDPITVIGTLQEFGCFLTVSCSRQLRQMDEHLSESTVKMMWWWWQSEGLLRWRLEAEKIRRAQYSWFTILTSSNVAELGAPLPHTQEVPVLRVNQEGLLMLLDTEPRGITYNIRQWTGREYLYVALWTQREYLYVLLWTQRVNLWWVFR